MSTTQPAWDIEADVVVLGSGGGGLTSAIVAHDRGAKVAILEKSSKVGGTTSVSGGIVWIPNNAHMAEVGIGDSREDAMAYVGRLADGRVPEALIARFVDAGPEMLEYVEAHTPATFAAIRDWPDYQPELPGGKPGGRSLAPGLFDTHDLGDQADKLRISPVFGMTPMTMQEALEWGAFATPQNIPMDVLVERFSNGITGYGGALTGPLFKACLDRGIEPLLETPAQELIVDAGRVVGVRAQRDGRDFFVRARLGVILATAGYEWNDRLVKQLLLGPIEMPASPPYNEGDGLRMAMEVGADLSMTAEAWWFPCLNVPGEEYEGRPLARLSSFERSGPHNIIVNSDGRRFVNEAANYNDMAKTFYTIDPVGYRRPNLPAWLILDQAFRDRYALLTIMPGDEPPDWLIRADSLEELAAKIDVDPTGLAQTVERFNGFAADGRDPDFHRGESIYDRFQGDPGHGPNPCLGSIAKPPFYALPVYPSVLGTKGGAVIDVDARVVHVTGRPIEGLYATGNAAAAVTGPGYGGAGGTIGPSMTFGYLAARHATATLAAAPKKELTHA